MPEEMPERMTVAAPVRELSPMSLTGRRLVSVKYPVSSWMALASTMPIRIAMNAITRGLPAKFVMEVPAKPLKCDGRKVKQAMATPITEKIAEMKKPRL